MWSHCHLLSCFGFTFIQPFCTSCLEKILYHLLKSTNNTSINHECINTSMRPCFQFLWVLIYPHSHHLKYSCFLIVVFQWVQFSFSSVPQSCLTLCDPTDCSTPGFPIHQQFPELTQTHVHNFIFNLSVSLDQSKSIIDNVLLDLFFPHSANFCLSVGEFNLLLLKLITDKEGLLS